MKSTFRQVECDFNSISDRGYDTFQEDEARIFKVMGFIEHLKCVLQQALWSCNMNAYVKEHFLEVIFPVTICITNLFCVTF